jgi:ribonuclease ZC3H12
VQYAAECGGVIVSTDNYRDLLKENSAWRETIENRLGKHSNFDTL